MNTTLILIVLPIIIAIGFVLSRPFMKHDPSPEETGEPESEAGDIKTSPADSKTP